jgi:hypothetical protein
MRVFVLLIVLIPGAVFDLVSSQGNFLRNLFRQVKM